MRWKVNRKKVEGKHLLYWIKKANIIIIDHGNEGGDIHIYKHLISTDSKHLKSVLDEYVKGDISSESYLEIKELKDDSSLFGKIFTYQSNQNDNDLELEKHAEIGRLLAEKVIEVLDRENEEKLN